MPEPRSPLKEFRHLDEKLHTVGLSSVEQARWESLRELVAPRPASATLGDPVTSASPGGFDVDAAAAALRESLQPAGLRAGTSSGWAGPSEVLLDAGGSLPAVPAPGPDAEPPAAADDAVREEWQAMPAGETWPPPAEEVADPWQAGPVAPDAVAGWDPGPAVSPEAGVATAGWDPNAPQAAWDPNAPPAAWDPNAGGTYDAAAWDGAEPARPSPGPDGAAAAAWDPNATQAAWDPSAGSWDPNAPQGWDPPSPLPESPPGWDGVAAGQDPSTWAAEPLPAGEPLPPADGEYDAQADASAQPADGAEASAEPAIATGSAEGLDPSSWSEAAPAGIFQATPAELASWDASAADPSTAADGADPVPPATFEPVAPSLAVPPHDGAVDDLDSLPLVEGMPILEELSLDGLGFEDLEVIDRALTGSPAAPPEAAPPLDPDLPVPAEARAAAPAGAPVESAPSAPPAPPDEAPSPDGEMRLELTTAAEFMASVVQQPAFEGGLELGDFGLEGVPEVSADDIQEIVETLGADFPAGTDVGDALPGAEAGPAAAPAHRVAPAPDRPVATPAVTVAVAAKEEPAGDDVVSLEEIAITPPPPHAEALAPLLSGSFSMPEEPPPPPAPVSPPLVVPAPTRVRDAGVVEAKEETTASYPVPPPPPASPAFAVPPRPVPPAAQTAAPAPPPPPPAPSPPVEAAATWGSTPTFVSGEHRVVFHTVAGQVLRGTLSDADLVGTELPLTLPTGETEHVESARLKAVFFMRAPGEAATASLGTKVRVTFADGRQIAGMSPDYAPGATGFFVIPLESRTNTGRIWVFRDAVRQISLG